MYCGLSMHKDEVLQRKVEERKGWLVVWIYTEKKKSCEDGIGNGHRGRSRFPWGINGMEKNTEFHVVKVKVLETHTDVRENWMLLESV